MIKFKVVCNWSSDIEIYNRFKRNYITEENFNPNFNITYENDYNYLIVFNRYNPSQIKCPKQNVFGFIMEPSWSNNWDKNIGQYCSKVFFHDIWLLDQNTPFIENFIEHPSFMFYHMKEEINTFLHPIPFIRDVLKVKGMSYIVSKSEITNDETTLYSARRKLADKILASDLPIDIYGNGWTDKYDKRIKGPINDKAIGLIPYKYSIAIENCVEKNYLTEKFIDCILCDCCPIHAGTPNTDEIYNKDCFIPLNLHSENVIEQLDNILKDDYNYYKRVDILQKMKLYYYQKYNIYNKIQELVKC
jgi:hypothetical protein